MGNLGISIFVFTFSVVISVIGIYIDFTDLFNNEYKYEYNKVTDKIRQVNHENIEKVIQCKLRIERQIHDGVRVGVGNQVMQLLDNNYMPYKVTDQVLYLDKTVSFTNKSTCFGLNKFVELFENNNTTWLISYKFVNYNDPNHIVHLKFRYYSFAIIIKLSEYEVTSGIYTVINHGKFTVPFPKIKLNSFELDKIADYISLLRENK